LTSAGEDDGAGSIGELDGASATSGFVAGREAGASVGVSVSEWKAAWKGGGGVGMRVTERD